MTSNRVRFGDVVDAQVHTWSSRDDPRYPWDPAHVPRGYIDTEQEPDRPDKVIADMDAVGVRGAILVAPSFYGSDNSYAIDAARRYPDRFAVVARLDWTAPDHGRRLAELMSEPGVVGIRLTKKDAAAWAKDGEFEPMLAAAEELDVPVAVSPGPENLSILRDVARRHPGLRVVVDHLGLEAPPYSVPEPGPEPFRLLPSLLALAEHPNVYVKATATAALSNEPYPFRDVWQPLASVVAAFGAERVMWGTDYNRTSPLHTYREAVDYLAEIDLFDDDTTQQLYSGTVRSVFGWPPAVVEPAARQPAIEGRK